MKLSIEDITSNFETHIKIIDTYISEPRASKVKEMIKKLGEEEYATAPASGKVWYHGSYSGGYVVHANTVVKTAIKIANMYSSLGGKLNFDLEELVFAALFHDLGKIGTPEMPYYIPNPSDWHVKNRGEIFTHNGDLDYMLVPDRSLFTLQKYGIEVSQQEYLAIKLHDGLFDESNKAYYISFSPDAKFKTNIVPILHTADYLASRIELDIEKQAK